MPGIIRKPSDSSEKEMSDISWKEVDEALVAEIQFKDFVDAFAFMTEVAALAEAHQHHPEWSNVYNRLSIRLTTHDAGNMITEKDRTLAAAISNTPAASLVSG